MENFDPKYMSGFLGEIYSGDEKVFEPRAGAKVKRDAEILLNKSLNGFQRITPIEKKLTATNVGSEYVLLPVSPPKIQFAPAHTDSTAVPEITPWPVTAYFQEESL